MRIGIYHEVPGPAMGGSEYVVAVAAAALRGRHRVDIVHHRPDFSAELLHRYFGTDLDGVAFRFIPPDEEYVSFHRPLRRYGAERGRYREISGDYDLWLASVHRAPPFCHARRGALFVHFPGFDRPNTYPWADDGGGLRKRFRRTYAEWEWRRRLANYQVVLANSAFTQGYLRDWWGLESTVTYAPAETGYHVVEKEPVILSVGRYASFGTSKNQLEMVATFRELERRGLTAGWEYVSVGAMDDGGRAYYDRVREEARGSSIRVLANVDHGRLVSLYERASIFWHAAGYGDAGEDPRLLEHFGLVTVEAMAAGCVPVVIARGGQPEIVEHGVSGFLWTTLAELRDHTARLVREPALRRDMSEAARERARHFGRESFERRLLEALRPVLD